MEVEMKIRGLMMDPVTNMPIVVLKDVNGNSILPIWVGIYEANAIALEIEKVTTPRPMTHDLIKTLLLGLGTGMRKVVVSELKEDTFYAVIWLEKEGELISVDSRPSDALALALRLDCPIFVDDTVLKKTRLDDLFTRDEVNEIRYLMNRARRTGVAATQIEYKLQSRVLHLALTVAALEEKRSSGFVLVVEDTSELLRAQKAAAWHEVARRVAHEIKNPLTPISLCSDRMLRQLGRNPASPDAERIVRECATTISREVESVKRLVDEFSQFSRFPAAQPSPADLNEIVESAMSVFKGRLEGIEVTRQLSPSLPTVNVDAEQFRGVVVNLVDNAAEAMHESPEKRLRIATRATDADSIELIVADTGCGVSREDKEKLFLPYFSTKGRGTGLGLAIVHRILSDHDASIRVEDNTPSGARFIVDIPVMAAPPAAVESGGDIEAEPARMPS